MQERAEISQSSEERELESVLKDIHYRLLMADLELEAALADKSGKEWRNALNETGSRLINELDQDWPYHRHTFLVTGTCTENAVKYKKDGSKVTFKKVTSNICETAISEGFSVRGTKEKPRLGYSFIAGQYAIAAASTRMSITNIISAAPEEVTLLHVAEPPVENVMEDSILGIIDAADRDEEIHRLLIGQQSFFDISHKRQLASVAKLVDGTNRAIVKNLDIGLDIISKDVYIPGENSIFQPIETRTREDSIFRVQGTLAGVALFNDHIYREGRVSSPEQLANQDYGICYELTDINVAKPKKLEKQGVVRVPLSSISSMNISM